MIGLDEARAQVLSTCEPLKGEVIAVGEAVDRVLVEPVFALHAYPNADVSAMYGYAPRANDATSEGARLSVIGESRAGAPWAGPVGPGEAVRIFTGAVVPGDADTIVIQEDTRAAPGQVEILEVPRRGAHIRFAAEGHAPGDPLLDAGARITPAAVGLLISDGQTRVQVHRRPRVAVLGTGDELLDPGEAPSTPGSVVDGNGPMIDSFVRAHGGVAVGSVRLRDDPRAIAQWLAEAAQTCDLLLTTGGASAGAHDCIAEAWSLAQVETRFWKVAVKPGKPLRFGAVVREGRALPVLALPGNPLAVLSALEQVVGPALARLSGRVGALRPRLRVPLIHEQTKRPGRAHLVRGSLTVAGFEPARAQGSHLLRAAAQENAVGDLPRGLVRLEAGASIDVEVDPESLRGVVLRPEGEAPRALCVVGNSDAGKTQLVEALVRSLNARELRVGTVKHATHAVELDTPGKDSWRHAQAGAEVVVLVGPDKSAVFHASTMVDRSAWLRPFNGQVDWVIIEGFRASPLPRIEVVVGDASSLEREDTTPASWRLTRHGALDLTLVERLVDALCELDRGA